MKDIDWTFDEEEGCDYGWSCNHEWICVDFYGTDYRCDNEGGIVIFDRIYINKCRFCKAIEKETIEMQANEEKLIYRDFELECERRTAYERD